MLNTLKRKIALVAVATVGAAGLVTIAAPAANAANTADGITATAVARVGGKIAITATLTSSTAATASTDEIYAVVLSQPAAGTVSTSVVQLDTDTAITAGTSTAATFTFATSGVAAGAYNVLVWSHDGGSASPSGTDPSVVVPFTAGGTPATFTLSSSSISAATGDSNTAGSAITVTMKDAAGVATTMLATESMGAKTGATAWVHTGTAAAVGNSAIAALVSQTVTTSSSVKWLVGNKTAIADTIAFSAGGFLSGQVTTVTANLSTFTTVSPNIKVASTQVGATEDDTVAFAAGVTPAGISGSASGSATAGYTGGTNPIFLSTATGASLKVSVVASAGNAGGTVLAKIAAAASGIALPAGVTAGTTQVTLDSTGAGSFTVTSTGPVTGTGYDLTFGAATLQVKYSSAKARSVSLSAPSQSTVTTVKGGSTVVTAKVKDQYGAGFAGAIVSFFAQATNRNNAAGTLLASGTSGADGTSSFTLTDASGATGTGTDAISFSAVAAGSATTLWAAGGNAASGSTSAAALAVSYATSITPATVTVSAATAAPVNTSGTPSTCVAATPCLALDNSTVYTATLKDATGTVLAGGIPVSWTITNGYAASATSFTASGVATLAVFPKGLGTVKVTATVGGVSGSDSTITGTNATTDARTIAFDAATYAVTGGSVKRVTATVKDRYGNPVAGVTVSFAFTGIGRFAGGTLTTSGTTDAAGGAIADIAPLTAESGAGTLTATYTGGDAATTTVLASDGTTAYPAAAAKATATTTTTAGGVSTDAATAAAQKATDAKIADIATAVTNLSTTVAGLVASLVAQIKDTKAAITATQDALTALAAVVNKIKAKVKA